MERNDVVNHNAGQQGDRAAHGLTDRRSFLTGAGKVGALLMGTALAGSSALETAHAQAGTGAGDGDSQPVEQEDKSVVRILGVTQRRPGLTKKQAPFADTPHYIPGYYAQVYTDLTKKTPGRNVGTMVNVVTDSAFGGDRSSSQRPTTAPTYNNLHIAQPVEQLPCTTLNNRDIACEVSFKAPVAGERPGGGPGWAPNQPRWIEPGTEMNLVMRQVLAHGTRPASPTAGSQKAMYFLKMSSSVMADNHLKAWQTLHGRTMEALSAFANGLRGYEVLQRLSDVPPRQMNKCSGEIALPDLVACFWCKDGVDTFPDYASAFRQADKENALDLPASFFLLVQEYEY